MKTFHVGSNLRAEQEREGCRSSPVKTSVWTTLCTLLCLWVCVCVCEGLPALSFSSNYFHVRTTANPSRPSYGNTLLPPAPSPSANYCMLACSVCTSLLWIMGFYSVCSVHLHHCLSVSPHVQNCIKQHFLAFTCKIFAEFVWETQMHEGAASL